MKSYRVTLKYSVPSGICVVSSVIPAFNSEKAIETMKGSILGDLLHVEAKEITEKP
jgi:hypothetical protein